jgi:hypothetical protein
MSGTAGAGFPALPDGSLDGEKPPLKLPWLSGFGPDQGPDGCRLRLETFDDRCLLSVGALDRPSATVASSPPASDPRRPGMRPRLWAIYLNAGTALGREIVPQPSSPNCDPKKVNKFGALSSRTGHWK